MAKVSNLYCKEATLLHEPEMKLTFAGTGRSDTTKKNRRSVGYAGDVQSSSSGQAGAQAAAQAAAAKSVNSRQNARLPDLPQQRDLSSEFENLTFSDANIEDAVGNRPYSEDVADRNIDSRGLDEMSTGIPSTGDMKRSSDDPLRSLPGARSAARTAVANAQPSVPKQDRYSEDVAAWDISQGKKPALSGEHDLPQPLSVNKSRSAAVPGANRGSAHISGNTLSRKPEVKDLRRSQEAAPVSTSVGRSSLDKSLPAAPVTGLEAGRGAQEPVKHDSGVESALGRERGYLVKDSEKPVDLSSIIDLRNTEDTTLHERWAPAVTHETITRTQHDIREEVITREIHDHHVFHRILPIVDVEVLPSRHFVPVEGGYMEISEDEVPGQAGPNAQWVIAETASKMLPKNGQQLQARQFTARRFENGEGDYREYMAPEGFKRTEQSWVHPPTVEDGGRITGQTYPFHFGSKDPKEDGLRASLPAGNLIGMSPLLAKQQRERAGTQQPSTTQGQVDAAPPVPPHKVFPAELVDSSRSGSARKAFI